MFGSEAVSRKDVGRPPILTRYTAGSHTHVFDPDAVWVKVLVTGGGNNASSNNGGPGSWTAIAFLDIISEDVALVVGTRGVTSSYNDGTNTVTANVNGTVGANVPVPGAQGGYSGSNAGADSRGGSSFWGASDRLAATAIVWGAGGSVRAGSTSLGLGAPGVIFIEEYF